MKGEKMQQQQMQINIPLDQHVENRTKPSKYRGPYGYVFENPVLFRNPIPYKGMLGLFNVPDALIVEA